MMTMTKKRCSALAASIGLALAGSSAAYAQQQTHTPRGEAVIVSSSDVRAVLDTLGNQRNIDKAVRTVDTNGPAGIVSVGAVAYRASPQNWDGTANEHSKITEVFHVTKGSATFVFGGDLENAKEFDSNNESVRKVFGPGQGGKVEGQRIVKTKVGDNVILPPNTPHNIIEVSEDFEMLVIRIDPDKVLEVEAKTPAPAKGPWLGTWKRNPEKSTSKGNGTAIFRMWEEGDGFRYTLTMTPASGAPTQMGAFGRFDGKKYPETGNPSADHNVFGRVDDHTYSLIDVKNGREMITFNITISPDGKTRTSVSKSRNERGEEVTSIGVWDRVE
jgi:hypothetical protein